MSEWDESAVGWDENVAVRAYAEAAFASLTALAEQVGFSLEGTTACDFGCGTGLLTELLADHCARIDAIDTSPAMLAVLHTKIDGRRWDHVRALGQFPSSHQAYDLIVCSSVLSFVDDYRAMVVTLSGHLAPGGLFVQWDWEVEAGQEGPGGLAATEVRRTLEHVGLDAVGVGVGFEISIDGHTMQPLMGSGRRRSSRR